jgi:hypothetical protein
MGRFDPLDLSHRLIGGGIDEGDGVSTIRSLAAPLIPE